MNKPSLNFKDILLEINFNGFFDNQLKNILVIVGEQYELYTVRSLNDGNKSTKIAISSSKKYNLAIVKTGYVCFD